MTERSYEDAVQILKRQFGGRWEVMEGDGRDQMIRTLEKELGYDRDTANDVIDGMVSSGELRYHRGVDAALRDETPAVPPVPPMAAGIGTAGNLGASSTGNPAVPAAAFGPGHWQIGRDEGESGSLPGRAGQVDPTE